MKRTNQPRVEKLRRRELLKAAGGCAALTNTSLLSTIFSLSATNAAVAQNNGLTGYKAMVCLFLFGGNDSYNLLSPLTAGEREDYLTARGGVYQPDNGGLGLPADDLHSIIDPGSGRTFGIHPSMPEMKPLYDSGKLGFLSNVGSLVEPTTKVDYQAQSNLPLGLFSHADLQRHWMTSVPQTRSQVTGWAGRLADLVSGATNSNQNISMNMSINNVNMLQTGGSVVPYVITDNGAQEVGWYGPTWTQAKIFKTLTDDALSRSYGNLIEGTFAKANRNALDAAIEFNNATSAVTAVDSFFPDDADASNLQKQLRMIAKTIGAQATLGQDRQIFFVSQGGWDNHDELMNNQAANLETVSQALKSFQDAMDGLGMTDKVVTFTASDFARTLNSNGKGSDHAWGGNQIVMGGPVRGGHVHGDYPTSLAPGNDLDVGRGRLIPTTSVDEMAAELAMWYGVENDNNMEVILPNVRNFLSAGDGYPIGFMS
ncbi:MAG: DUF1501 domain-containing protein [Rubripirellula sp.]|nr:DUF1501 domain-containing protein [Rubripirellula sp.]